MSTEIRKSEQEWREQLTSDQYHVMREEGTERPVTGAYVDAPGTATPRYSSSAAGTAH